MMKSTATRIDAALVRRRRPAAVLSASCVLAALSALVVLPAMAVVATSVAIAGDDKATHTQMKPVAGSREAVAVGVVNSVDAASGKINVTHEPVPALGWPKMTMDLAVTRRVDLSKVKSGSTVNITLKQGRDKQFRVIAIEPRR